MAENADIENPDGEETVAASSRQGEPEAHTFEEIVESGTEPEDFLTIDDLRNVHLSITAELGRCRMLVRDILDLHRGSVIQLDKLAGEMTDVLVNGLPLAKGEIVVIGDALHVRIGEITGDDGEGEEQEVYYEEDV